MRVHRKHNTEATAHASRYQNTPTTLDDEQHSQSLTRGNTPASDPCRYVVATYDVLGVERLEKANGEGSEYATPV